MPAVRAVAALSANPCRASALRSISRGLKNAAFRRTGGGNASAPPCGRRWPKIRRTATRTRPRGGLAALLGPAACRPPGPRRARNPIHAGVPASRFRLLGPRPRSGAIAPASSRVPPLRCGPPPAACVAARRAAVRLAAFAAARRPRWRRHGRLFPVALLRPCSRRLGCAASVPGRRALRARMRRAAGRPAARFLAAFCRLRIARAPHPASPRRLRYSPRARAAAPCGRRSESTARPGRTAPRRRCAPPPCPPARSFYRILATYSP